MNINHLKLFIHIAKLGNIRQAGKVLGLSPAVSSAQINKLEEFLGTRLLHRTTRKVSLTVEGEVFLPHAHEILERIQAGMASIVASSVHPNGKIRISAPASFGRMHIVPLLNKFLTQYPNLEIELHLSDTLVNLVEGGFDLAIRNTSSNNSKLIQKKIADDKRILCASPSYLSKFGTPKVPTDLLKHNCVNLIGLESWNFSTINGPLIIKTNNKFRTDNGEAARDATIFGLGISQNSRWCCYKQLESGKLVQVLEPYPLISDVAIWAVYPNSRLLSPKVAVFLDFLKFQFSDPPWNL